MRGYDRLTAALGIAGLVLLGVLAYLATGVLGLIILPILLVTFYLLPSGALRSIQRNGVRLALVVVDGLLVGWIAAEYLGDPPIEEPGEITFTAGLLVFALGVTALSGGLYSAWRYYHISTTETSRASSVDEGKVEVEGDVDPLNESETPTAPVSGEDCVAYEYEATQRRHILGRSYRSVVEMGRNTSPFYVDDGTGRVLVDPEGARIDVDDLEVERRDEGSSEYDRDTTLREKRVPDDGAL